MHPAVPLVIHTLTAASVGLSAGLLFAYSVSVNPGLAATADDVYLSAMQAINKAIQNPAFFTVYFSPLILLPLSCRLSYKAAPTAGFTLIAIAGLLYVAGVIGVTAAANVPLNNLLDAVQVKGATAGELRRQRLLFEGPWNRWHALRTVAASLSFVLLLVSLLKYPAARVAVG